MALLTVAVAMMAGCGAECVRCNEPADGGGPETDAGPRAFTESNVEACTARGLHRGQSVPAVPFTPPSWPARVDTVRMILQASSDRPPFPAICDHSTPFDVLLFKGLDESPPREPEDLVVLEVAGPEGGDASQAFEVTLEPPVDLAVGETLFVGLRLPEYEGSGPSQCVAICGVDAALRGDWTSPSLSPPFFWSESRLEGTPTRLLMEVDGELR